jgi:hypothetical protein
MVEETPAKVNYGFMLINLKNTSQNGERQGEGE